MDKNAFWAHARTSVIQGQLGLCLPKLQASQGCIVQPSFKRRNSTFSTIVQDWLHKTHKTLNVQLHNSIQKPVSSTQVKEKHAQEISHGIRLCGRTHCLNGLPDNRIGIVYFLMLWEHLLHLEKSRGLKQPSNNYTTGLNMPHWRKTKHSKLGSAMHNKPASPLIKMATSQVAAGI